jgi:hypothetical protein
MILPKGVPIAKKTSHGGSPYRMQDKVERGDIWKGRGINLKKAVMGKGKSTDADDGDDSDGLQAPKMDGVTSARASVAIPNDGVQRTNTEYDKDLDLGAAGGLTKYLGSFFGGKGDKGAGKAETRKSTSPKASARGTSIPLNA